MKTPRLAVILTLTLLVLAAVAAWAATARGQPFLLQARKDQGTFLTKASFGV